MPLTRRKFIRQTGITAMSVSFAISSSILTGTNNKLEVHLFSKHLHFLDIKEASQKTAELGFDGLDLTVRPKGHILPENVSSELPDAINTIKDAGISCKMITTAISDVDNPLDKELIASAAMEGVKFYRSNWFKYKEDLSLEESLTYYQSKIKELSELNKIHGIVGCYQNHSGTKVGASFWEIKKILASANQAYFGAQYDIRHAVAEGGRSWSNGVKLLKDQIKTIVLKDFKWGKVEGKWKIVNTPIGEGMVDFITYFKLLKKLHLQPPVSLHLEYPLGGAEKGKREITVDRSVVYNSMQKDLDAIQKLWRQA